MKILMVNKYLYPRAGPETYMLGLAEKLLSRGHEVAFFGMEHPNNTPLGPSRTVPFIEFGQQASFGEQFQGLSLAFLGTVMRSNAREFVDFCDAFQPDVIHAHNVNNQLNPSLMEPVADQVPVLMTVHDYKMLCPSSNLLCKGELCKKCIKGDFNHSIKNKCVHGSYFKSTLAASSSYYHKWRGTYETGYHHFVAPSQFMKDRLIEGGYDPSKISVIHNFIELRPYEQKAGDGILYLGRLSKEKGLNTLLDAYIGMSEPRPFLTIAGDGPQAPLVQERIKKERIRTVRWLGAIPPYRVQQEIDRCAVTVVPSVWYENCSMAILESLGRGRPVVVTNLGGSPEIIQNGKDGVLFEVGDAGQLRTILTDLLSNQEKLKKMSLSARKSAEKKFCSQVHTSQIESLYRTLKTSSVKS